MWLLVWCCSVVAVVAVVVVVVVVAVIAVALDFLLPDPPTVQ